MERLGTLKIDRERAGGAVYARNRTEIERGRRISVKIRELELEEKVSGRMTMSCTEQYLFKFLPPSGPPPHAFMLAAGTHPNRRVALVQIVAARCTEPDEHELGSLSLFLCLNSLLSSLNSRLQALVSPKTNKELQNRPILNF